VAGTRVAVAGEVGIRAAAVAGEVGIRAAAVAGEVGIRAAAVAAEMRAAVEMRVAAVGAVKAQNHQTMEPMRDLRISTSVNRHRCLAMSSAVRSVWFGARVAGAAMMAMAREPILACRECEGRSWLMSTKAATAAAIPTADRESR